MRNLDNKICLISLAISVVAGLPDVAQYMGGVKYASATPPGAYVSSPVYNKTLYEADWSGVTVGYVTLVLSRSNAIYGKSTTVTPLSRKCLWCIKYV